MTREEIGNKPASKKTFREDLIGKALEGECASGIRSGVNMAHFANFIIEIADAVIERLATESAQADKSEEPESNVCVFCGRDTHHCECISDEAE